MPMTKEECLEEYLLEVDRYALISHDSSLELEYFERCMVYDTKFHEIHLIDNNEYSRFIKRGLFNAGCVVIANSDYRTFRKPLIEYFDRAILDGIPPKEVRNQMTQFPWPFPRRRT